MNLIGMQYNAEKKSKTANLPQKKPKCQNDPLGNEQQGTPENIPTADRIAKEHGISPATVKRAGKFAKEVAAMPREEKIAVLSGEKKIPNRERE